MKYLIIAAVFACAFLNGMNCDEPINYENLTPTKNVLTTALNSPRAWSCNSRCCPPLCAMLGYSGGYCEGGKCMCNPTPVSKVCHGSCCHEVCTKESQILGKCEGAECMCYAGTCTDAVCSQHCNSFGSGPGSCKNNICQCSGAMSVFANLFVLIASCLVLTYQKWM